MLDGRPGSARGHQPAQRLILPSPNTVYPPPDQQTQPRYVQMADFPHSRPMSTPAMPPYSTKKRSWRNDPAFIVLVAAICFILLSSIVFSVITSKVFFSDTTENTTPLKTTITPQGTIDTHPIFPTPGGNQGGTIPTVTATMPVQPTQTQNVPLTVQVNAPPTQVSNNTTQAINITTSNPNIPVKLVVTYSVSPYFASTNPQMTDANGNTTILWKVAVHASPHHHTTTAHLMVICGDQPNKRAVSQTFLVQIMR